MVWTPFFLELLPVDAFVLSPFPFIRRLASLGVDSPRLIEVEVDGLLFDEEDVRTESIVGRMMDVARSIEEM